MKTCLDSSWSIITATKLLTTTIKLVWRKSPSLSLTISTNPHSTESLMPCLPCNPCRCSYAITRYSNRWIRKSVLVLCLLTLLTIVRMMNRQAWAQGSMQKKAWARRMNCKPLWTIITICSALPLLQKISVPTMMTSICAWKRRKRI